MKILKQIIQLLTCCLLLIAIAINKNQKIGGTTLPETSDAKIEISHDEWNTDNGFRVISTKNIAKDIWGYSGNVPLFIYLKDNKINRIEIQPNSESPEFISSIIKNGLLSTWTGLSPQQALLKQVDAVTGATLSSNAIITSVQKAMQYAENGVALDKGTHFKWNDIRFWCVLVIVLSGIIVPLYSKNKYFRIGQLCMNVAVLGFWSGSFISLSLLVNYLSNGINLWMSIIPLLLLIAAFIFPLFGKKSHYCMWICPMGSCQELLGKIVPDKIKISPKMIQDLNTFRDGLWLTIMMVMWLGVGFELLDYELFSVFLFYQAPIPLLIIALLFAILSGIVQRPYCRFVCPTGSLFKFSQQSK